MLEFEDKFVLKKSVIFNKALAKVLGYPQCPFYRECWFKKFYMPNDG